MSMNFNVIRDSFAKIAPKAPFFMNQFYKNLFQMYPISRELFQSVDMEKQKKQLTNALVFVVQNLENSEALVAALKDMGRRHAGYGVKEEGYNWVGGALMKTLEEYFGNEWTEEYRTNWEAALMFIARTMIEGAKDAPIKEVRSEAMVKNKDETPAPVSEPVSIPQEPPTHQPHRSSAQHAPVVEMEDFRLQAREWARKVIQEEFDSELKKFMQKMKSA